MACGETVGGRRGDGAGQTWAATAKHSGRPNFLMK